VNTLAESPAFMIWAWPGPQATARIEILDTGQRVLSMFFDPVTLILTLPPFPDGEVMTARFLRSIARACAQLSAEYDPTGAPLGRPGQRAPGAHRAEPDDRRSRRGGV
jgi:hypothetical protein